MKKLLTIIAILAIAASTFAVKKVNSRVIPSADDFSEFGGGAAYQFILLDSLLSEFSRWGDGTPRSDNLAVNKIDVDTLEGDNTYMDSAAIANITGCDVIAGNPAIDSISGTAVISGNPVIDSIQGMDIITGNPVIDSIAGPTQIDRINIDTMAVGGKIVIAEIDTGDSDDTLSIKVGAKEFLIVVDVVQ